MKTIREIFKERRSIYQLNENLPVSFDEVKQIIEETMLHTPSAFNSQGSRFLVLTGDNHKALWDKTKEILKPLTPESAFENTAKRMDSFKAAYGTILLFEDTDVIKGLQEKYALYAENFPLWSEQTHGMHTFALWTLLESLNIGANLQHYNPLIDEYVATTYDIPQNWKLRGQLVFGGKVEQPDEKQYLALEDRIIYR